jgi:hypothetical protein
MRTALLAATVLVAFSSLAVAQNQSVATTGPAPAVKPIDPGAAADSAMTKVRSDAPGGGRLHYDVPCRVSSAGTCITEPPPYPPYRPRP